MYTLFLCWRYLRTRWIALASVVSVMLGVATMIVVNGVMEGFTREMQGRIHGILSDVVFEANNLEGFPDAAGHMRRIEELAGPYIAGMTPTVALPGQLAFEVDGEWQTRHVSFIGVDTNTYGEVSDFNRYLRHPQSRKHLDFTLHEGGYDLVEGEPDALKNSGWPHRRRKTVTGAVRSAVAMPSAVANAEQPLPDEVVIRDGYRYRRVREAPQPGEVVAALRNPFEPLNNAPQFDPSKDTRTGVVLGLGLARVASADGKKFLVLPGDDVKVTVPTATVPPKPSSDTFTVVDLYESGMSEYDANFIFMPLAKLQEMRGMIDRQSGVANVTAIQIKLHNDADGEHVRNLLREAFPGGYYSVHTWRDKQGPLLAAVGMQTVILNILLGMIILVAGFGIFASFCMIVAEKRRDIGILKSLGASSAGVMSIFLSYGLSLGIVGAGAGMLIGLVFIANIQWIADLIARLTGQEVFDPTIYYFQEIPTVVEPLTVLVIVTVAIAIAVQASVIPALMASFLKPVEALRNE